jgi:hypothetical protein
LQLGSDGSSSQYDPIGPSSPWWNDCGNDRYRLPGRWRTSLAPSNPRTVTLPGRTAATLARDRPGSCRCLEARARRLRRGP